MTIGGREFSVEMDNDVVVSVNGTPVRCDVERIAASAYSVVIDGIARSLHAVPEADGYAVLVSGLALTATVESGRMRALRGVGGGGSAGKQRDEIHAPMPALVVRVEIAEGDQVTEGQGLIVLEAMKMENELKAHKPGVVREIRVRTGETVDKGQILIVID